MKEVRRDAGEDLLQLSISSPQLQQYELCSVDRKATWVS